MESIACVRTAEEIDTGSEMELAYHAMLVTEDLPSGSTDVVDDLDDPWFATEHADDGDVYEVDPVHPLRRLSAWVRDRLAA